LIKRSTAVARIAGAIVLISTIVCGAGPSALAQGGVAGTVTALHGAVTLTRGSVTSPVAHGNTIDVGDTLKTSPGSEVTVTLTDGTQLQLGASTALVVVANSLSVTGVRAHTRVDLLEGLLHSLVRFAPGNAPNYEVHTPNAVAAARGTNYDVDYAKGTARKQNPGCLEFTDVSVFEGLVEVSNPTNRTAGSVMLGQGHKLAVPCSLLSTTMVTTVNLVPAVGTSAATGVTATTIGAGTVLGGAVVGAGVVGGLGASGGLGGNSSGSPDTPSR
jgi:hypothetical protein